MTICFDGLDIKYEIESITKIFLPAIHFSFLFDDEKMYEDIGDKIIISLKDNTLKIYVLFLGKEREKKITLNNPENVEYEASSGLFLILSEITGISPKWGCLTGIRPVKKLNELLYDESKTKEEAFEILHDKYFLTREKFDLCYDTSVTQKRLLDNEKKNSYSLYVAIPFCPTRCKYCSFVSHSIKKSGAKLIPEYTEKLCHELEIVSDNAKRLNLSLDTIYIGGGTPTAIPAENLDKIMGKIEKCYDISKISEYTVEAGRADTITEEKLRVIKNHGADRISINPQSMVDSVLSAVGREHTGADVIKAYETARKIGFNCINTDTIAGLPTDTFEGFKYTIDTLVSLEPENITVHTLTLKRSADLYKNSEDVKKNISVSVTDEMVSYAYHTLKEHGYNPYYLYRQKNTVGNLENVGYAKKGTESLYNIYIMDESQTILAAGASGSTKLVNTETGLIRRQINYKYPYEYISDFDMMIEKKQKEIFG